MIRSHNLAPYHSSRVVYPITGTDSLMEWKENNLKATFENAALNVILDVLQPASFHFEQKIAPLVDLLVVGVGGIFCVFCASLIKMDLKTLIKMGGWHCCRVALEQL